MSYVFLTTFGLGGGGAGAGATAAALISPSENFGST